MLDIAEIYPGIKNGMLDISIYGMQMDIGTQSGDKELIGIAHGLIGGLVNMELKDYLIEMFVINRCDVYDLDFDKIPKDDEGETLDFENYQVNEIEGDILKISMGGDWQEPKQGVYKFDGVNKFNLIGIGEAKFK